jgi:ketosteroid isomerase-like protein
MDREYTDRFLTTARATATDASDDPQAVLHAAYDAIIRSDFDALGEFVTDDVELNICGFPVTEGNWRGRNDVVAAAKRNYGRLDSQQPEIEAMISQGESIGVLLRESGVFKSTGQAYSIRGVLYCSSDDVAIRRSAKA